mgnify:FL=1
MKRLLLLALLTLLFSFSARAGEKKDAPTLLIPRARRVPTMDGKIEDGEWADAAAVSGFIQPQSGLVQPPRGIAYIKHDGERLYFAFRSKLLPGQEPTRRYRKRDEPVYMDSNRIELWITAPVDDAKTWSYQFIGNAYGAIFDMLMHPELGSQSLDWDGKWNFKGSYEVGEYWDTELSIAAKDLGVPRIEPGQVWKGLVALAWPQRSWPYTGGWFKNVGMHARWIMGADGETVQIENVKALLRNKLDLNLGVNAGDAAGNYSARATVDGTSAESQKRIEAGGAADINLKRALKDAAEPRTLSLTVKGPEDTVLFNGSWEFKAGIEPPKKRREQIRAKPFPAEVNYAAEAKAIRAWADLLDYPKRQNLDTVRISVHPKGDDSKTIQSAKVTSFDYDQAEKYIWLPDDIAPGRYAVRFAFLDRGDGVLDQKVKEFKVLNLEEEFHWYPNDISTDYSVKPNFDPIRLTGQKLDVWGRTYVFDNGALPSQIVSQGAKMLSRPISLVVVRAGQRIVAEPVGEVQFTKRSETRVRLQGNYTAADIHFELSGYLDFDGTLFYTLSSRAEEEVDAVYLSMPVQPDNAMYFHTTAGGWSGAMNYTPDAPEDAPFWSSLDFSDFVPYVGLSDDDRALQWFADNDHSWILGEDRPCVQIWRHEGEVELRTYLVQEVGRIPTMQDVEFGFIATPVKPLPEGWRNPQIHYSPLADSDIAFFWGSGHGGGLAPHEAGKLLKKLDVTVPEDKSPEEVLDGLSADVQGTVEGLSSTGELITCPFHNAHMYFPGYRSRAFRTFFPGDWREYPPGGWFHLAPTDSYQDFYLWYFDKWVKHISVRGVYYDEAYLPKDYNVFNGSGKVMPDGSVRPSINLMRLRRYFRRVRQTFINHGVEPFIWVHSSNYMAPHTMSWAHVAMFGEDRSPTAANDYLDVVPPILFRAIGRSQKFGLPPIWMNQVGRGGDPLSFLARQVCGWCWMHDTGAELHPVARGRAQQGLRIQWGIAKPDVTYHAYWTQQIVTTGDEDYIVSIWKRPDTALLQVFNLKKDASPSTVNLAFDADELGLGGGFTVYDLESAPRVAELKKQLARYDAGEVKGGRPLLKKLQRTHQPNFNLKNLRRVGDQEGATVTIAPRDFVLLVIK